MSVARGLAFDNVRAYWAWVRIVCTFIAASQPRLWLEALLLPSLSAQLELHSIVAESPCI